jgi:imidazolonepropionase
MRTLYSNIKQLIQTETIHEDKTLVKGMDMALLPLIEQAWLLVQDGLIEDFGAMNDLPSEIAADRHVNLENKFVLPTWCDSHTHLVFSHSREQEFVDRIHGLSYEQIAQRGGGILNSAKRMQEVDEDELFDLSCKRLEDVIALGTGAIEIKSGYGLNTESELKMLRVIKRLKELKRIDIKASFLAAHTYPLEFRENHQAYIDLIDT